MKKKFPERIGHEPKPDNVNIIMITRDDRKTYGLGTDNNVYQWWGKYRQWTIPCLCDPDS